MKNLEHIILILIGSILGFSQEKSIDFSSLSVREIDTISFDGYSIEGYRAIFNQANILKNDSLARFKGTVIMDVLAESFEKDLKNKIFNPRDKKVKELITQFEKNQYLVYQPRPSNFIKLMYYLCNYKEQSNHIRNRFSNSIFFIPTITFFIVFIVFTGLNIINVIKWKHKMKYYKFLIVTLILIIIMSEIFNQTCDECVKKDSFYGIPL